MKNQATSLTKIALQKFKKNFWGVLSLGFIVVCILVAVFAYSLAPDNSENANQMHLSIHSKSPGFKVQMLTIPSQKISETGVATFFFGKKTTATEIPISAYETTQNGILITEYTSDGSTGLQKEYETSLFKGASSSNAIASKYVSEKKDRKRSCRERVSVLV